MLLYRAQSWLGSQAVKWSLLDSIGKIVIILDGDSLGKICPTTRWWQFRKTVPLLDNDI